MSWPGNLSTDVTRVGNVVDNVIGFNVCHNISPPPFFSTYFAYPCFLCSVSGHISTDVHLLIQLLGICIDQSNWAGAASASCIWKDLWLGYYFDFKRLADVLHWKPYFTRFVHFSLSFAFAFCGRWHVSHMCLVSVVPHITCVLCCKCAVCVTCVLCHVCDCVSCVKDTQGQLSSGLFLLVVALVRALAVFGFVPDKVPTLDKQWEEEKRQSRDRVGKYLRSWKKSSICKHCRTGNGWVQDTRIVLDHWVEKYPKGKKNLVLIYLVVLYVVKYPFICPSD